MTFNRNPLVRFCSTIVLLAGLWFVVSPWVFGASSPPMAFNNWIVGGMIVTFAYIRLVEPGSEFASWVNLFLGAWVLASPWIQAYAPRRRGGLGDGADQREGDGPAIGGLAPGSALWESGPNIANLLYFGHLDISLRVDGDNDWVVSCEGRTFPFKSEHFRIIVDLT
jgi:hypothetical protein